jgi:hypothetical protein
MCLDIISCFDEFLICHIPREENGRANTLVQQASGYKVMKKSMHANANVQILDELVRPLYETGPTDPSAESNDSAVKIAKFDEAKVGDWIIPIIIYLKDSSRGVDRSIGRLELSIVCLIMSSIAEPAKICFSNI